VLHTLGKGNGRTAERPPRNIAKEKKKREGWGDAGTKKKESQKKLKGTCATKSCPKRGRAQRSDILRSTQKSLKVGNDDPSRSKCGGGGETCQQVMGCGKKEGASNVRKRGKKHTETQPDQEGAPGVDLSNLQERERGGHRSTKKRKGWRKNTRGGIGEQQSRP